MPVPVVFIDSAGRFSNVRPTSSSAYSDTVLFHRRPSSIVVFRLRVTLIVKVFLRPRIQISSSASPAALLSDFDLTSCLVVSGHRHLLKDRRMFIFGAFMLPLSSGIVSSGAVRDCSSLLWIGSDKIHRTSRCSFFFFTASSSHLHLSLHGQWDL